MRTELEQGARQLAQSSGVAERLDAAARTSREAATRSQSQLGAMQRAEGAMRRTRLCELAAALPVYVAVSGRASMVGEAAGGGGAAAGAAASSGGGRMSLFAAVSGVGMAPSIGQKAFAQSERACVRGLCEVSPSPVLVRRQQTPKTA
jgi:hypothetical protein